MKRTIAQVLPCTAPAFAAVLAGVVASGCAQNAPTAVPLAQRAAGTRVDLPSAQKIATVRRAIHVKSRIDPAAAKGRLLYVADPEANAVLIYTYPQLSGAGEISGFSSVNGVCTDRQGYVWILDTSDVAAWEFAHGGTAPINYVQPGDYNGNPGVGNGCSIDPKSGNLAVAGSGAGITVFLNGQETPHDTYWDYDFFGFNYIGYDGAGDLYADGILNSSFQFGLVELVKGSLSLDAIAVTGATIRSPGGIQWDAKYLDVADGASGTIYQTSSQSSGGLAVVGSVETAAPCQGQFYILASHKRVIVTDPCNKQSEIYAYPGGGTPIKTILGGEVEPLGAAISVR